MRQPFKDLAKAEWGKQKLYYEALIRTESYHRLVEKSFTRWAKEVNLDLNHCDLTIARERFFEGFNLQAGELANNLGIPYLFDPEKAIPRIGSTMTSVRTIHCQDPKFLVEENPPTPGSKLRPLDSKPSPPLPKDFIPLKPHKRNGRHLLVEIDLNASKERIFAEMDFLINIKKRLLKADSPFEKDAPTSEPFKIYDMYKPPDESLIRITWSLFPVTNGKNPNEDPVTKSYYMKISRLYKKAEKLIKEAEKSIPKSLKPRLRRQGNAEKDKSPV